uniref:RRM domain-containing protein n=1 Tax=Anopheles culicifacies TaxID=139723 RepID=A0A182M4N3_9DIPT
MLQREKHYSQSHLSQYCRDDEAEVYRKIVVPYLIKLKILDSQGKPFFTGLDEHLNDEDGSGGGGFIGANQLQLNSPARSSPHSNGSETTERFSRKVFVGGLPPDIDEVCSLARRLTVKVAPNGTDGPSIKYRLMSNSNNIYILSLTVYRRRLTLQLPHYYRANDKHDQPIHCECKSWQKKPLL